MTEKNDTITKLSHPNPRSSHNPKPKPVLNPNANRNPHHNAKPEVPGPTANAIMKPNPEPKLQFKTSCAEKVTIQYETKSPYMHIPPVIYTWLLKHLYTLFQHSTVFFSISVGLSCTVLV